MLEIVGVFGERLQELRKERRMTQEELADKLGLHNSYIGLLERGERIPSLITLDNVAKVFGVKSADLISTDKRNQKHTMRQKEMIYIVEECSSQDLEKIYKIFKIVIGDPHIDKPKTGRGKRRKV